MFPNDFWPASFWPDDYWSKTGAAVVLGTQLFIATQGASGDSYSQSGTGDTYTQTARDDEHTQGGGIA